MDAYRKYYKVPTSISQYKWFSGQETDLLLQRSRKYIIIYLKGGGLMHKKPNVLFIVTDDQRFDTIHALGNEEIITPTFDNLVERGTSFVRGVKDESYKLIEYRNGDKEEDKWTFLYDIKNDPWETENLAIKDEYAGKIKEMREKILRHRDEWEEQSHPWGKAFWKRF